MGFFFGLCFVSLLLLTNTQTSSRRSTLMVPLCLGLVLKESFFSGTTCLEMSWDTISFLLILLTALVLYYIEDLVRDLKSRCLVSILRVLVCLSFSTKWYLMFFFLFECSVLFFVYFLVYSGGYSNRYEAGYYFLFYSLLSSFPLLIFCSVLSSIGAYSITQRGA